MIKPLVKKLLRDCPDGRLRVLIALAYFVPAPTCTELANEIPMNRKTVGDHLHGLGNDGYVWNKGQRWYLTSKGEQLTLPVQPALPGSRTLLTEEVSQQSEASCLTLSSSSSLKRICEENQNLFDQEQLPLPQEVPQSEASSLTLEYRELAAHMIETAAAPHNLAWTAIRAAAKREDYPSYIRYQVALWLLYIQSGRGSSINNPGAFICRKIERDEPIKEWFRPDRGKMQPEEETRWRRIDHLYSEWRRECEKNEGQDAQPDTD